MEIVLHVTMPTARQDTYDREHFWQAYMGLSHYEDRHIDDRYYADEMEAHIRSEFAARLTDRVADLFRGYADYNGDIQFEKCTAFTGGGPFLLL